MSLTKLAAVLTLFSFTSSAVAQDEDREIRYKEKTVIDFELAKVRERLFDRGYVLELTDDAKEFLISKGSNLDYGARPLRRAIEQRVEDPLSEELLRGEFEGMNTIVVDAVKNDEGKVTRLAFRGENRADIHPPEPVGAAATVQSSENGEEKPAE